MINILIHTRIKIERERAGLSQEELASRAGLPARQTITEIENGKREIKAWELAKIADVLAVDIHTFLAREHSVGKQSYVFWRQVPNEKERQRLENMFFKMCEAYALVERLVEPKAPLTKELPLVQLDIRKASFREIFDLAKDVRTALVLGERPGCLLTRTLEEDYGVKIFDCPVNSDCSAACAKGDFGSAILLNSDQPIWRRTYSCAHELFHLITWNESLFESLRDATKLKKRNEQLSDVFAAGLLMPGDQVKADLHQLAQENKIKHADIISLATKYGVSTIALLWRLHNIGCISKEVVEQLQKDKTFKELDRAQRSNQEAGERLPARFVRLVFQAVTHGKLSRAKAADMLGVALIDLPEAFRSAGFVEPHDDEIEVSAA